MEKILSVSYTTDRTLSLITPQGLFWETRKLSVSYTTDRTLSHTWAWK
jgi:hypothetical protein